MSNKKLYRSESDRKVSGVCGGLAEYFNIDSTVVRLLVALCTFISAGTGLILYFIAAVIMPEESDVKKDGINPNDII